MPCMGPAAARRQYEAKHCAQSPGMSQSSFAVRSAGRSPEGTLAIEAPSGEPDGDHVSIETLVRSVAAFLAFSISIFSIGIFRI